MQAGLDWKPLNTYHAINGKTINSEDMMSIPTSITTGKVVSLVKEEVELAIAA
jgi:hypothetical protein